MVITTADVFRVSGDDFEEVGPHNDWDFTLTLNDIVVSNPYKLRRGQSYTFRPVTRDGEPVSLLLIERA